MISLKRALVFLLPFILLHSTSELRSKTTGTQRTAASSDVVVVIRAGRLFDSEKDEVKDETLALMKQKGVALVPTDIDDFTQAICRETEKPGPTPSLSAFLNASRERLRRAIAAGPLFEFGEQQIRKRGAYLPFGATLNSAGEVGLEAATSEQDFESPLEVLPLLHEGLRAAS